MSLPTIKAAIETENVVMVAKSYCPFCKKAKVSCHSFKNRFGPNKSVGRYFLNMGVVRLIFCIFRANLCGDLDRLFCKISKTKSFSNLKT